MSDAKPAARIAYLPGDGVGPEVLAGARSVMAAAAGLHGLALSFETCLFGGAAIDAAGDPLPPETLAACLGADAVLLGAVGGPAWDKAPRRPEAGLLELRAALGVFANLWPAKATPGLEASSPLRPERFAALDLLIIRELTGGLYFGAREEGAERASDLCLYTREEVRRVARVAFEAARQRRGRVTSVDKANVLATSRLWRTAVIDLHAEEYADVALDHMLVDAMAMRLVQSPDACDVILTENLFGDILSDEASALAGSIGLAPSASIGAGPRGLFEPIHGSAPDIAGRDRANPIGAILSGAMLLRMSLGADAAARSIEMSVARTIADGVRTVDLGGEASCAAMASAIADRVRA